MLEVEVDNCCLLSWGLVTVFEGKIGPFGQETDRRAGVLLRKIIQNQKKRSSLFLKTENLATHSRSRIFLVKGNLQFVFNDKKGSYLTFQRMMQSYFQNSYLNEGLSSLLVVLSALCSTCCCCCSSSYSPNIPLPDFCWLFELLIGIFSFAAFDCS